jgi:hypothetical protein
MSDNSTRQALLREARRRKKLYPSTAALQLAGLWFPGPNPTQALRRALDQVVAFLPAGLLERFVTHPAGYVIVVPQVPPGLPPRTSCYLEGEVPIEGQVFRNVACVLGQDLGWGSGVAQHELTHLLDHLLGSDGQPEGICLSEGGGVTPALRELGRQLQVLYQDRPPGDYRDWIGPRGYLARAAQCYCVRPAALQEEDPAMYHFLDDVLLAEAFWQASTLHDLP